MTAPLKLGSALILVALIGCGASSSTRQRGAEGDAGSGGGAGDGGTGGSAATGGTGGTGGTGASGGSGGVIDPDDTKTRCKASNVEPPMLRRLTNAELGSTLRAIFPELSSFGGVKVWSDPLSALRFTNDGTLLEVGPGVAQGIFESAVDLAKLAVDPANLPVLLPCATSAPDAACAGEFIDKYGRRLFRRPLSAEERAEFLSYHTLVAGRSDFALALKWTLVAMIQSPFSVYRSELGDAQGNLSQHEIATELAYAYTGTTPSEVLLTKADNGELGSTEAIVAEAKVLLATPAGNEALLHLFAEWAEYERVSAETRDDIGNFAEVRAAMVEETRRFIGSIVFQKGGNVRDLLTANTTFLNPTLASFYGFGSPTGDFTETTRPADWGIGLLAQASLLTGTSYPDHTSPVFRGLLVLTKILCEVRPQPPAVVPPLGDPGVANTTRERYEKVHLADPSCAGCHSLFDPYGYALEHFDQNGRYRADERGFPIDAAAKSKLDDGSELVFDGLTDLANQLAARESVTDCVSGLMSMYAFGGGGGKNCLAEKARAALANGEYGLLEFYAQLAAEPSFVRRVR